MPYRLTAACGCSTGNLRRNNEDNCYFDGKILRLEHEGLPEPLTTQTDTQGVCFAVFDGMGGEADGQLASYMAAATFQMDQDENSRIADISEDVIEPILIHLNEVVTAEALRRQNQMGTTAVLLGFRDDRFLCANVGDSRAYRYHQEKLTQISLDHVATLPPDVKRKPGLTQCLGTPPEQSALEPWFSGGTICDGDLFLLCSDGLTDMVTDSEIERILAARENPRDSVQALLTAALDAGGRDNITVILLSVSELSEDDARSEE